MSRIMKPDVILGFVVVLFALALLLLWIPNDVEGDIINKVRRRSSIGDPMAPTITGILLLLCGLMLSITGLMKPAGKARLRLSNAAFLVGASAFFALVVIVMLFTGPLVVSLFGIADEYRLARATAPWKYLGFLLGGFVLLFTVIVSVERRVRVRSIVLALVIPLVIAMFYDLPFDDTLLPPNGDY